MFSKSSGRSGFYRRSDSGGDVEYEIEICLSRQLYEVKEAAGRGASREKVGGRSCTDVSARAGQNRLRVSQHHLTSVGIDSVYSLSCARRSRKLDLRVLGPTSCPVLGTCAAGGTPVVTQDKSGRCTILLSSYRLASSVSLRVPVARDVIAGTARQYRFVPRETRSTRST